MVSVLVVDDEVLVRELYSLWLDSRGHRVWQAGAVAEAKALLEQHPCDVIVTDIRMAQSSGIDLLAWIRTHHADLPVILVTGAPAVDTAVNALRLKAYDYLLKPIDEYQLVQSVERAYQHHQLLREKARLERENDLYRRQLEERVEEQTRSLLRLNQRLLTLHELVRSTNRLEDISQIYSHVLSRVQDAFAFAVVAMLDINWEETYVEEMVVATSGGVLASPDFHLDITRPQLQRQLQQEEAVIANHIAGEEKWLTLAGKVLRSAALFPVLTLKPTRTTVLIVAQEEENGFDENDKLTLNTLAGHLQVTLANARLYKRAQDALRVREQVLQNVSHELRTPLAIIHGYAEMLLDSDEHEGVLDLALDAILEQSRHLHHLVDQLISFHELSSTTFPRTRLHVAAWVSKSVAAWSHMVSSQDQRLNLVLAEDVGDISANEDYLLQVLNNIIGNAHKFSPPGSVIDVRVWKKEGEVFVSVSDEGIGVTADKLPFLFDRFYQAEGGANRRFSGMGLGLSLAQEIIIRHGGRIWAESDGLDEGTTVVFSLPAIL